MTSPILLPAASTTTSLGPGDPAYSMLTLVAGTLIQLGTGATAYVSRFALAPSAAASTAG